MKKISVLLVVHNEEKQISDCLERLSFSDEIVVILEWLCFMSILMQCKSIFVYIFAGTNDIL